MPSLARGRSSLHEQLRSCAPSHASPSFYRGRVNALVRFVVVDAVRRSRACVVRVPLASVSYFATLRTRVLHALGFWIR